jgi:hypothetical protein
MSQTIHTYRNTANGKVGEMTESQAALWPNLLVRVDADPVDVPSDALPEPAYSQELEHEDEPAQATKPKRAARSK